jgi:Na+/H+-translocating membrane pyrophosphatase
MTDHTYIWKGGEQEDQPSEKQTLINESHAEITEETAREQLLKISEISRIIEEVRLMI